MAAETDVAAVVAQEVGEEGGGVYSVNGKVGKAGGDCPTYSAFSKSISGTDCCWACCD